MLTTIDKLPNWLRTIIFIFAAIGLLLTINFLLRSCQPEPALTDAGQAETKKAAVIKSKIDSVSDAAVVKSDKHAADAKESLKRADLPRRVIVQPGLVYMGGELVGYESLNSGK